MNEVRKDEENLGEESSDVGGSVSAVGVPINASELAMGGGPKEAWFDAFVGEPAKIITDPVDGMPRPDDVGQDAPVAPPLSAETLVCLADDSMWVEVFGHHAPTEGFGGPLDLRRSRSKYDESGREREPLTFGPDVPREKRFGHDVALYVEPSTGERSWVVVQPRRFPCKHFSAFVSPVSDIDVGGRPAEPLFMFCDRFKTVGGAKMSLFDETITACTERDPPDAVSAAKIASRIEQKIAAGRSRTSLPIFKKVEDGRSVADWQKLAAATTGEVVEISTPREALDRMKQPSTVTSTLVLCTPKVAGTDPTRHVRRVALVSDSWQPPAALLEGQRYGSSEKWGVMGADEAILRIALESNPPFDDESDAALWPGYKNPVLPTAIIRSAKVCADYLSRGLQVDVVATNVEAEGAFFVAVVFSHLLDVPGLDALEYLQQRYGKEMATNLSFRVFLRNVNRK
jgi:hypothetical protein